MVRFVLVGASNTAVTLAAFMGLGALGVAPAIASAGGFAVGATNGYVLNRRWTFRARGGARTVARYVAVQAIGLGVSAGGVLLATTDLELRRLLAELVVLPFVTIMTYILIRRAVFRTPESAT